MSYELKTLSTTDLTTVTGGNGRFDYLMQQKPQAKTPAKTPAHGGSSGPNWLQRTGGQLQSAGEVGAAAGGVGTCIPALGETGIPEAVAGAGGATWLLGKGMSVVGGWFHH